MPTNSSDALSLSGSVWSFTRKEDDSVWRFNTNGQLTSVTARNGRATNYTYTSGRLTQVANAFGRTLTFTYDGNSRLRTVTASGGDVATYGYDGSGRLSTVTRSDSSVRTYVYENTTYPSALTGIVDERGNRYSTYAYDSYGRATSSELAGGVDKYQVSYAAGGAGATVTDPLSTTRDYTYATALRQLAVTSADKPSSRATPDDGSRVQSATGLLDSETDFLGTITTFTWDGARRLPLTATEASNRTEARTTTTQWHASWTLPILVTEPRRTTAWTYDANGNPLTQVVTDTATSQARTWSWTYNAQKLVATSIEPNSSTTTYTWNANGTLQKVSNALSQETSYIYDAAGRVTQKTDPSGLVTTYGYDTRGRPTSIVRGTETAALAWDGAGLLSSATLPGGATLAYTYDNAQRLTQIQDGLGNKIVYTLDNMGNVTKEQVFDPSNVLARTRDWAYNALNRLDKEIGGATPLTQVTEQTYDLNANPTATNAPLSRNTSRTFDYLNRVKQVTDPAAGITKFEYDAQDNVTKVTDPNNLDTTYTYNGFGDLLTQTSLNTGVTSHVYNSAGQLQTQTDARSVTATYTWDTLGRVATITYPDETVTYTYDSCTYGVGRLCSVQDKTGTTSYTYTQAGRIATKSQVIGALTQTVTYAYNTAGQLTQITTPSGKAFTYTWANGLMTGVSMNGTAVVKNATYVPFGAVNRWEWGNSTGGTPNVYQRTFDTDGRLTKIESSATVDPLALVYDPASRITNLQKLTSGVVDPAKSVTAGYDLLDRLTSTTPDAGNPLPPQAYTYDAATNRTSRTDNAATTNYTYASGTQRLQSLSGAQTKSFTYDATGNRLTEGLQTWTYGGNNRPTGIAIGGLNPKTIDVGINAMGQRLYKTVNGFTTRYVYDEGGRLLGQYDTAGRMMQETLWFADMPVGAIK